MPIKPMVSSQLDRQTGMGRPGGAASRGSAPAILQDTKGAGFASMANMLLKGPKPDPKRLSPRPKPSRQGDTLAAGGETRTAPRSPTTFSRRVTPSGKAMADDSNPNGVFGWREREAAAPATGRARVFRNGPPNLSPEGRGGRGIL